MILLLGGTADSCALIKLMNTNAIEFTVSVVSDYGKELAIEAGAKKVIDGALDESQLEHWILTNDVTTIVDATHPFAVHITNNAIVISQRHKIKFLRYEREETTVENNPLFREVATFQESLTVAANLTGPWFFTTGSRHLKYLIDSKLFPLEQIYIRVLPDSDIISQCYQLGFRARNIIAMQGPASYQLNKTIYTELAVKTIITKDGGHVGGTVDKIKAGLDLELNVILIKKPINNYQLQHPIFTDLEEIIKHIKGDGKL